MMKRLVLAAASALALAACGSSDNGSDAQDLQSDGAVDKAGIVEDPAAAQAAAQPADNTHMYVAEAAISDLYEIQSSRVALERSKATAVKEFAKQMIADHTATTAKLKPLAARQEVGRVLPTELDPRRQAMIDTLKSTSGSAFDKAYLDQQSIAHQEALRLHGNYAANGDKAPLKAFAAEVTPKIQHHADMLKQLAGAGAD